MTHDLRQAIYHVCYDLLTLGLPLLISAGIAWAMRGEAHDIPE